MEPLELSATEKYLKVNGEKILENNSNIDFWQDTVERLSIKKNKIEGIVTKMGITIIAKSVILQWHFFKWYYSSW